MGCIACGKKNAPPPENPEEALIGEWENAAFKVDVASAEGGSEAYTVEVNKDEWEVKMNMLPIKTQFLPDHKYKAEYRSLGDSLLRRHRGIWKVFGDSLVIIEPDEIYQYQLKWIGSKTVHFQIMLDWDGDGQEDDDYKGIYEKVK